MKAILILAALFIASVAGSEFTYGNGEGSGFIANLNKAKKQILNLNKLAGVKSPHAYNPPQEDDYEGGSPSESEYQEPNYDPSGENSANLPGYVKSLGKNRGLNEKKLLFNPAVGKGFNPNGGKDYNPANEENRYNPTFEGNGYNPTNEGNEYNPANEGNEYNPTNEGNEYNPANEGNAYNPREGNAYNQIADDGFNARKGGKGLNAIFAPKGYDGLNKRGKGLNPIFAPDGYDGLNNGGKGLNPIFAPDGYDGLDNGGKGFNPVFAPKGYEGLNAGGLNPIVGKQINPGKKYVNNVEPPFIGDGGSIYNPEEPQQPSYPSVPNAIKNPRYGTERGIKVPQNLVYQ